MLNAIMKKLKKFITFFLFALFFTIIGYEYPMIIDNSKKYVKFKLKNAGFIDSFISESNVIKDLNNQTKEEIDTNFNEVSGNSFNLKYKKIININERTSGFFVNHNDKKKIFEIYLQEGLMIKDNQAKEVNLPYNISFEKNGGVKSIFKINKNIFLLLSNKENINCYYASIFSLSINKTLFKTDCLPDYKNVDFNGLGGAFVELENSFLLSIGAPEWNSSEIRSLAQDTNSLYGKFILFKKEPFIKNKIITTKDYTVFSLGHKNPQGITKVENKLLSVEHGPQGGDEINLLKKGSNYGWPLVSYGTLYNDGKSFKKITKNIDAPIFSFLPSIAPSSINNCPDNLKNYYKKNYCLIILSLRGQAIFVALIDKKKMNLVSIEKFKIGQRLRHFGLNSKNLLFQKDDSFYISIDSEGVYEISFGDFR